MKLFDGKLYVQSLRRIRLPALLMTGSVVALHILFLMYAAVPASSTYSGYEPFPPSGVACALLSPVSILLLLFGVILMLLLFRFLAKREEADFYHSLPLSRPCLFFTLTAAALTYIWGALLVVYSLSALYGGLFYGHFVTELLRLFLWYLVGTLVTVTFAGLAVSVTGTTLSAFLVVVMLCSVFRLLAAIVGSTLNVIVPALPFGNGLLAFFEPSFFLPIRLFDVSCLFDPSRLLGDAAWWCVAYNLLLCAVALILGCFFFTKRESEQASRPAPSGGLQAFYRITAALPLAMFSVFCLMRYLLGAYRADNNLLTTCFVCGLLAVFVYFLYELITVRKSGAFLKALVQFPVLLGVCGVAVLACVLVRHSVLSLDTERGDVVKVEFVGTEYESELAVEPFRVFTHDIPYNTDFSAYELVSLSSFTSRDPAVCEFLRVSLNETLARDADHNGNDFRRVYRFTLRNGRTVTRAVRDRDDEFRLILLLSSDEENRAAFLRLPDPASVSVEIYVRGKRQYPYSERELYDTFRTDFFALSEEKQLAIKRGDVSSDFHIVVTGYYEGRDFRSEYPVPRSCERMWEWYYASKFGERYVIG